LDLVFVLHFGDNTRGSPKCPLQASVPVQTFSKIRSWHLSEVLMPTENV